MKHIIRKPKFMRNEGAMATYIVVAETIAMELARPETTPEEEYYYFKRIGECLDKAAKAGGFFRTKDFIKWLDEQKCTI